MTVVASIEVALEPEAARESFGESLAPTASWTPDWAAGKTIELETRFEPVDGGTRSPSSCEAGTGDGSRHGA